MRIVVHGQQAFGKSVLQRLLERNEDIVAVCCAPTKEGHPEDLMAELARENNIPVHQPVSWKTPEALELMQSFEADVCMMAYVLLFVPEAVLNAPKHGTFQYHPSLCPEHRGPSSINWPIAMGKTRTGLTIFWPDDGLDEGPIMIQKSCAIGPDDTIGDVYFKMLFPMGVDAMIEGLDLVKAGVILKHDQRLEDGSYESWFKGEHAVIDWSQPVAEVYNIIRAANPAPGATCEIRGVAVQVYDSKRVEGTGTPGEVVSVEDHGIVMQAEGGRILIERLKPAGGKKQPAAEWINGLG